jgi:hypothetical protein
MVTLPLASIYDFRIAFQIRIEVPMTNKSIGIEYVTNLKIFFVPESGMYRNKSVSTSNIISDKSNAALLRSSALANS